MLLWRNKNFVTLDKLKGTKGSKKDKNNNEQHFAFMKIKTNTARVAAALTGIVILLTE